MGNLYKVSPSPHVHGEFSIKKLMYGVVIAMLPPLVFSVYYFGVAAIIVTGTAVISCVLVEYLIQKFVLKQPTTISDGSAVITGMLLAFNLPANLPVWMIIIGSIVSIGIAKMSFGGLGNNPFNPALVGRVFLLVSFPVSMTSFPEPRGFATSYLDAVTGSTPLAILKESIAAGKSATSVLGELPTNQAMLFGEMGGSMGEIAAAGLILGLIYMLYKKVITWHIPITIIVTIMVFTGILWQVDPDNYADPMFHILTGGALLGAIYMATDYVTSPMVPKAMIIYALGIGLLTVVIRTWGAYPEGISFAILIMNGFVPLLNRYIKPKRFGEVKNG